MKNKISLLLLLFLLSETSTPILARSNDKNDTVKLTILANQKQYIRDNPKYNYISLKPSACTYKEYYNWRDIMPPLQDTIKIDFAQIDYERDYADKINGADGIVISFNLYDNNDIIKKNNFIFYDSAEVAYDARTGFIADWYNLFNRITKKSDDEVNTLSIYLINDTIYTSVVTNPVGGTTPEGNMFRFSGKDIESVTGRSRGVFRISQIFDHSERDGWYKLLYYLETPWNNYFTDKLTYQMPVFKNVTIDKDIFEKIRKRAVEIQQYYLIEKRDSVIASYQKFGESSVKYIKSVYENLDNRLKPNFEDAATPNELYLLIEFAYFVNKLTINYKDGMHKKIVHIADYVISVP